MFAEEHSSNTSRRRQEAARARRRELKKEQKKKEQQQQQQQQQQKLNEQQQQQKNQQQTTPTPTTTLPTPPTPPSSTTSSSAVDEALRQRQIRHENQRRITASITIQSTYRSHHSRLQTYTSQSTLFDKRLSDLSTLSRLISAQNNSKPYIPPPATVSMLTDHLLFLSKKQTSPQRWATLSQYALLPGATSPDDDTMDPLSLWLQSPPGRRRFRSVLAHSLANLTPPSSRLLRLVAGCGTDAAARPSVVAEGRRHLRHAGPLDVLVHLRSRLVIDPIPSSAAARREGCVPPDDVKENNALFEIIADVLETELSKETGGAWVTRFVTEILTVPLALWKIPLLATLCRRKEMAPPLILRVVSTFLKTNERMINAGGIVELLPVVNLTTCPCPSVLSLLANLSQLMRLCDVVNATQKQYFDYDAAATYLSLLSTLVGHAPIGTFSSRSAVEWIHDEHKSTPIILSPVVIDHCRILLVESYVRSLFLLAIDDEYLKTEEVLTRKGESDERYERDLRESGGDAMSLAVREARVKRSAWVGSRWARKLSQSVSNLFTTDTPSTPSSSSTPSLKGSTKLLNTSTLSRQLAHGHQIHTVNKNPPALTNSTPTQSPPYSPSLLLELCRLYAIIITRWGGNGYIESEPQAAMKSQEACVLSLLNVLTFSTGCVRTLWGMIQGDKGMSGDLNRILDKDGNGSNTLHSLSITPTSPPAYPLLLIFISTLTHTLLITDDCEIHDMEKPLPKHQILRLILLLKKLLYTACRHKTPPTTISTPFSTTLISTSAKLMRDLYDRSSRRPLCLPKLWIIEHLLENDISKRQSHEELLALLSHPILTTAPFLVPFQRRLLLFSYIISTSRAEIQGSNVMNLKPGIPISIGRHRVLEDGLRYLNTLGPNLRRRIVVSYLNEAGVRETGVDVGGMFKEFWTDLSRLAFDPNYALFRGSEVTIESGATASLLYPNPLSGAAHGADHVVLFQFLGRILGKALYEGITIQPLFAHFFLSFLRGDYNFLHMMSDLSTLDQQLYNNLMFLKNYEGDVADLCLTFSIANDDFGTNREIPLIPNGANIDVTSVNKQRYIALVAKHHVCDRLRTQSEAFTTGLNDVIPSSWLKIFNEPELQVLISGSTTSKIDVDDMKSNSRLTGGYTMLDRNVHRFWNIVKGMTEREQAMLLKFVTSCERPPPLGFQSMNPPFTIQRVGITRDDDKLPTAATCFNTLKLPTYSSEKVMKQRLLFSIKAGAGFELT